jgi:hypothetical protein
MLKTGHLFGCEDPLEQVGSEGLREQLDQYLGGADARPILQLGLFDSHSHEVGKGAGTGSPILVHDDVHAF